MEKPEGFREGDRILLEQQQNSNVRQILWTDGGGSGILRITQQWKDGEEMAIYLPLHELEELAQVARDYMSPPNDGIQEHEDYLDAQDRHDNAMRRY